MVVTFTDGGHFQKIDEKNDAVKHQPTHRDMIASPAALERHDPLRAAQSPQATFPASRGPVTRRRDPLELMRVPTHFADETHYSATSSAVDTTMQTSYELSFRTPYREWSVGLLDGTQMESSLDQSFAPADFQPPFRMQAPDHQHDESKHWPDQRAHQSIWPRTPGETAAGRFSSGHAFSPELGGVHGAADGHLSGELPLAEERDEERMSPAECRRYGVPIGSKWVGDAALKRSASPQSDPRLQRIDWDQLPAVNLVSCRKGR